MNRSRSRERLLAAALIAAALLINVVGTYRFKTAPFPGSNDFYSRWSPTRTFWLEGLDPYGDAASLKIQRGIYGRPALPDEDPGYFAYPFYTVILFAPLGLLPYAWAEAVWIVILEASLVGALLLLMDLFGWRPRPWLLGLTMLWTLVFYPAARGLMLGQPGLLVYFLEVLALWALARERDVWAGAALACSTIKPQMGFLLVPALLGWALWRRRWRLVGAFAGVWGALMLLSFLLLPGWMGAWLDQVSRYTSYTAIGSPVWVLARVYLPLGAPGEVVLSAALAALTAWAWWRHLRGGGSLGWAVCLTLAVTHLIALRTATPHFVVFIIPLVFYFQALQAADRRRGPWVVLLIEAVLFVGLWALFLATVQEKFEHVAVYLPLPFGMLAVLLMSRGMWEARRPLEAR